MRIAFVGCGYVGDFYIQSLPNHRELELVGVYDRDEERCMRFSAHYGTRTYGALEELLSDPNVELVVNLTNPRSHYEISKAALERGKHVYSEKPLAMHIEQARELVEIAEKNRLLLASAPCNVLSETAQTIWKVLREGRIGQARLAYAHMDAGMIFSNYKEWYSKSGAQWPFDDEFETGCTLEHVGYYLGWLSAFFGPALRVSSFGAVLNDGKGSSADCATPDYTVGSIEFVSGQVARITCGLYGPRDHSLKIFGDDGVLSVDDCWDYHSKVFVENRQPKTWREKHPRRALTLGLGRPKIPLVRERKFAYCSNGSRSDWCRGIAEQAEAVAEKRESRLSGRWSLHVNELALAISNGYSGPIQSTFDPMKPMPWAS
jgi:predicted dehydrogenase